MNYQIKFVKDKIKSLVNKNKQLDNEIQNTTSGDVKAVKKKQKADNNNELRKSRTEKYEMEEIQEDVRFMKKSCMLLQKLGLIKSQYQFCNEYLKRTKHYLSMLLHCLKPKKIILNDAIAFFLATIIKKTITDSKYSDQISSTVLPIIDILLPSIKKDDGSYAPDWQYMEKYIDNVKQIVEQKFDKIKQIKEDKNVINSQQWAYFHLYCLKFIVK